jgi:hypothetical protein
MLSARPPHKGGGAERRRGETSPSQISKSDFSVLTLRYVMTDSKA